MKLDAEHAEPDLVGVRHVVARGETLFRIAKAYGVSPDALTRANGLRNPGELEVGQELVIPEDSPSATARGRSIAPERLSASALGATEPSAARPAKAASRAPARRGDLDWPLRGVLYARFGKKAGEVHDGIDLAAPLGTPIKAAHPGTVLYAGEQKGYGLIAIVDHANGLTTLYAHNRDLRVKTGQLVRDGQVIATVGESGRTTGPHLHFEVRKDGIPVDPLDYLGPIPQ
ncbi:MAG TPA: M23 family metallopeptidase [Myxococcaceae bacterium]|nr:M23 family metallopeptidase [Myxococcaceae bacterium]